MTVSIRLRPQEEAVFKAYAKAHGVSLSEAFRRALTDKLEDEYDLKLCEERMAAYKAAPTTFTQEEVESEFGLR